MAIKKLAFNPTTNKFMGFVSDTIQVSDLESEHYTIEKAVTFSGYKLQERKKFAGFDISIENKKGSFRHWKDQEGNSGKSKMHSDYGYFKKTLGRDKDHLDVFLGPNESPKSVYVIHQNFPDTGKYDEDKVMLGFDSSAAAKIAYLKNYNNSKFFGGMSVYSLEKFREKALKTLHGSKKSLKKAAVIDLDTKKKKKKKRDYEKEYEDRTDEQKTFRSDRRRARKMKGLQPGDPREVDHVKPLSKKGSHDKSNLKITSRRENRMKSDKEPELSKAKRIWVKPASKKKGFYRMQEVGKAGKKLTSAEKKQWYKNRTQFDMFHGDKKDIKKAGFNMKSNNIYKAILQKARENLIAVKRIARTKAGKIYQTTKWIKIKGAKEYEIQRGVSGEILNKMKDAISRIPETVSSKKVEQYQKTIKGDKNTNDFQKTILMAALSDNTPEILVNSPTVKTGNEKIKSETIKVVKDTLQKVNSVAGEEQSSLNLTDVRAEATQIRQEFKPEQIRELAETIVGVGLLHPIVVRPDKDNPGKFLIVAGERRYRAISLLKKEGRWNSNTIRASVKDLSDEEKEMVQIIENTTAVNNTPLEIADFYQTFVTKRNMSVGQIAKKTKKSWSYVKDHLNLGNLHPELRKMVKDGNIPRKSASLLGSIKEHSTQIRVFSEMLRKNMNVIQLQGYVKGMKDQLSFFTVDDVKTPGQKKADDSLQDKGKTTAEAIAGYHKFMKKQEAFLDKFLGQDGAVLSSAGMTSIGSFDKTMRQMNETQKKFERVMDLMKKENAKLEGEASQGSMFMANLDGNSGDRMMRSFNLSGPGSKAIFKHLLRKARKVWVKPTAKKKGYYMTITRTKKEEDKKKKQSTQLSFDPKSNNIYKAQLGDRMNIIIRRPTGTGIIEETVNILQKGKKPAGVGEERVMGGILKKKQSDGTWIPVKGKGKPGKEKPGKVKKPGKLPGSATDKLASREKKKAAIKDAIKGFLNNITAALSGGDTVAQAGGETSRVGSDLGEAGKRNKRAKVIDQEKKKAAKIK